MSDKSKQPQPNQEQEQQLHTMRINGQCATPRDAKRILTTPAHPVDKSDLATKPLHSAVRDFQLLK
jgi:hypothetical protein